MMNKIPRRGLFFAGGFVVLTLGMLIGFAACGGKNAGDAVERVVADPMGNTVQLSGPINRIISTAPANTEILIDLELGEKLIAVDKYSLDIPGVNKALPSIDFVYPDAEAIISLRPDLIIASEHNRITGGEDPFALIREAGIAVVYIPSSGGIAGIYRDIAFIAGLLGVPERGERLALNMKETLDGIAAVGAAIPAENRKTVYFEISPAPNMVSFGPGTFLHEMIELIGAENIFADTPGWIAPGAEAIAARNPGVILTNVPRLPAQDGDSAGSPAGGPVTEILTRPGFARVKAVRDGAVYWIDTDTSSRPTPHITAALLQMTGAVYPEYYARTDLEGTDE
jgi:iron complex transport system substrate-binding protein